MQYLGLFCPPYERSPYKNEWQPFSQGGAKPPIKGGDLTPTGTEELKSTASMLKSKVISTWKHNGQI